MSTRWWQTPLETESRERERDEKNAWEGGILQDVDERKRDDSNTNILRVGRGNWEASRWEKAKRKDTWRALLQTGDEAFSYPLNTHLCVQLLLGKRDVELGVFADCAPRIGRVQVGDVGGSSREGAEERRVETRRLQKQKQKLESRYLHRWNGPIWYSFQTFPLRDSMTRCVHVVVHGGHSSLNHCKCTQRDSRNANDWDCSDPVVVEPLDMSSEVCFFICLCVLRSVFWSLCVTMILQDGDIYTNAPN